MMLRSAKPKRHTRPRVCRVAVEASNKPVPFYGTLVSDSFFWRIRLKVCESFFKAFPDLKWELISIVSTGDTVACELIESGTMKAPYEIEGRSVAPTNRSYRVPFAAFFRVNTHGLLVEQEHYGERSLMRFLEHICLQRHRHGQGSPCPCRCVRPICRADSYFLEQLGRDDNRAPALAPCPFRMSTILQPIDELAGIIVGSRHGEDDLQRRRRARSGSRHDGRGRKGSGIGGGSTRSVGGHQEMELVRLIVKDDRLARFDGEGLRVKAIDIVRPCLLHDRHRGRGA